MNRGTSSARGALAATIATCLVVVPIALAAGGDSEGSKRAGVAKQLKKLKRQVEAQGAELAAQDTQLAAQGAELTSLRSQVTGDAGTARPPSGPAGGELTGSYPNPSLAEEAGFTKLTIDGPCPGQAGNCPGKWDSDSLTMTRKDGSGPVTTYQSFYNGEALGFSGSNGDAFFISGAGFMDIHESGFGGNPPANTVRIFPRDVAGVTQLVAKFSDGEIDILAVDN